MSKVSFPRPKTVRAKMFSLMAVLGFGLGIGAVVNLRIVESMHAAADWRVYASDIMVLAHELRIGTQRLAQLKGSPSVGAILKQLDQDRVALEQTFRKLRGGVSWEDSPAMSDPLLLEVLDSSETFWREEVTSAIERLLLEPADTFNLSETERLLDELAISIGTTSRRLERLLERKMKAFSSYQWAVVFIDFLAMVLAALFLTRTERRIREVAETAQKINSGQEDTRAPVNGEDEIALLAKTFNEMTSKLIQEKLTSERIVASIGDMLLVVSNEGVIRSANEASWWTTGHLPIELLDFSLEHAIGSPSLFDEIRTGVLDAGTYRSVNLVLRKKDGSGFPASLTATAIPGEGGFVLVIRDVTPFKLLLEESERRAAAEASAAAERSRATEMEALYRQLAELRTQAYEAGKLSELGEMAAGIAHEINNPVTIIAGKAMQLKTLAELDALDKDKLLQVSDQIEQTAFRVSKIIKSLRQLARDGSRELLQPVSVKDIISDVLDLCAEKFRNDGIQLEVSTIPEDLDIECRGVQISQVLVNLLNNAHDAVEGAREKRVWIDLATRDHRIEISVTDSGPGIPEAIRDKIMQPFFTTKSVGKGTGLGLSISRTIVAHHNGELELDAACANTRFVVRLPLVQNVQSATLSPL